jgi:hypothetical protein
MDLRPYEPTVAQRAAEQFITDRVMPLLLGRRLKHAVTPGENVKLKDFEESSLGRNGFRVL